MKNKSAIKVSVITINFYQAKLTKRCVELLLSNISVRFEIIVIDNSCDRNERKLLKTILDKRVRFFFPKKNIGCCAGYNMGIRRANGTYVFILNNDTEIRDIYALHKMVRFMNKHSHIGVIQPKIKSLSKPKFFEYSGAAGGYIDILGYPFCRGRMFQTIEEDRGQYDSVVPISWASTCAFFARKSVLIDAGLFDPIYFAYAEEVDICLAIWKLGYQVMFYPWVTVLHQGETTWKKIRGRKTYLIHRNHLILYLKCFPKSIVLKTIIQRFLFEFLSVVYYLGNRSNLHIFFVALANFSCMPLIPSIMKKRKIFYRHSKEFKLPLYQKSIVLEYFLHKKKYFLDLDKDYLLSQI